MMSKADVMGLLLEAVRKILLASKQSEIPPGHAWEHLLHLRGPQAVHARHQPAQHDDDAKGMRASYRCKPV